MSTIDNLITKNRPNFELWERQLGEHLLTQYEPEAIESKAEDERIFFQTNELLIGIADNFFVYESSKTASFTDEPLIQLKFFRQYYFGNNTKSFIWR
jgi:hypothetical protein